MEQAQVEQIFSEIGTYRIELESDPTILGPQYINRTIAQCRNYLNRVSSILLSLNRARRDLKKELTGEEAALELEKDGLLATNETVKRQPSVRDREAVANTMLRTRLNKITTLKGDLLDLETVEQAVKLVHSELVRTNADIKTQRATLHVDRIAGTGYGDESSEATPSNKADDLDEAELDRIMQESAQPPVEPETQPDPEPDLPKEVPSKEQPFSLDTEVPLSSLALPEEDKAKTELYREVYEKTPGDGTSSETPAGEEELDPDLARFLESANSPPTVSSEPPKKEKSDVKVEQRNDDDFDLDDLLSKI